MPLIFIVQQPQPRFQTALSYVTYLFSEWRISGDMCKYETVYKLAKFVLDLNGFFLE